MAWLKRKIQRNSNLEASELLPMTFHLELSDETLFWLPLSLTLTSSEKRGSSPWTKKLECDVSFRGFKNVFFCLYICVLGCHLSGLHLLTLSIYRQSSITVKHNLILSEQAHSVPTLRSSYSCSRLPIYHLGDEPKLLEIEKLPGSEPRLLLVIPGSQGVRKSKRNSEIMCKREW